ncbi:RES family NAD+ phosphorylase [Kineococcus aurantiacus]|uniref:RES family NAD+ phosphorylase n=1 Tax=Kineococcus aurantiacus TaxID=37633 RepID=UPI0015C7CD49
MPGTPPPADLTGFPVTVLATGKPAYRIFRDRDPATGITWSPWFFSCAFSGSGSGKGRFDLPAPEGSCYLSDRQHGAWLEVFRGTGMVDRADVDVRRILHATRTRPLKLATLIAAKARSFGITADVAAGDDYSAPQSWAAALRACGHGALLARARHDPTGTARTIVEFGVAGSRAVVRGWRTKRMRLTDDVVLLAALSRYGTGVAPVPARVAVIRPS